jgi:prepilin-type processing-associated H-X9-DG protein
VTEQIPSILPESAESPAPRRKTGKLALIIAIAFVFLALQFCMGIICIPGLDMLFVLVFGWIYFLVQTLPKVTVRWEMFPLGLLYCSILIAGSHYFLGWLYGELHAKAALENATTPPAWRWQWTFSAFGLVILMFAAGIGAIGVVHQTTWLIRSPLPLYGSGPGERANRVHCGSNLRQIGQGLMLYANDHKGRYPADLVTLIFETDLNPEVFVCPSSNDEKATGPTTQALREDFAKPHRCSYIYCGNMSANSPADMVLAYENPENHENDGMNVLYNDGHVDWIHGESARRLFADLQAGRNPPGNPSTQP